ncbi:HET-domain-containing protein [Hypoxylon sp. NC1633]|nr:HET-domain-containing protein [Hypoxylon sp. NC1633]
MCILKAMAEPKSPPESESGSDLRLCAFCRSIPWAEVTTGPFNPRKAPLEFGNLKSGEHNLGAAHAAAAAGTCELCALIVMGSRSLKPWWPIAHLLGQPQELTHAFWSRRNRIGGSAHSRRLAQVDLLLDEVYAGARPGYRSDSLTIQKFLDELVERGISLDGKGTANAGAGGGKGGVGGGEEEKKSVNTSLNRVHVVAGVSPVDWTDQTFMQLHPCVYPVPSVDEYVRGEAPFTVFPTGRLVNSVVNIGLLRKWYVTCVSTHGEKCAQPPWLSPDTSWPAKFRLIDVRRWCLVEASDPCRYFALSYVWGDEKSPFQTTSGIRDALKTPGSLRNHPIPKTIIDAMELTKEMGADFLWVDRLCVVQDSDLDQAVQIPQMDLVYSCAAMTIVAASGTAVDGLAGINSTPREVKQQTARVAQDLSLMDVLHLDQSYEDSRWTTRGWTFQEGLCSRRTLIITPDQIFWSCETGKCCESIAFEDFPTAVAPNDIIFNVLTGHRVFGNFGGGNNFAYAELNSMVQSYCSRKLTVQADALDAFTGVLRRVALNTGHEFYWGHSVSMRFDESLAWSNIVWYGEHEWKGQGVPERRREMHRVRSSEGAVHEVPFPSWSWLGWKEALGVTRIAPRQVMLEPELNIMRLSMDGKAVPLCSHPGEKKLESVSEINMCGIDSSTSAGWKGATAIDPSLLHQNDKDGEFKDSGRLLFWTSHAVLSVDEEGKIYSDAKEEIGELKQFWPYQVPKPAGKHSFIVVSRMHDDNSSKVLRAQRRLNVLAVEWDDPVQRVASRTCVGDVHEETWIGLGEKREWILVTLA